MSLHHGADDAVSLMFSSTGAQETGSSNFGGSIIVPFPLAFRYETISGLDATNTGCQRGKNPGPGIRKPKYQKSREGRRNGLSAALVTHRLEFKQV